MDPPHAQSIQSILAVDCGTLWTRALLFEIVADEYRFVGSGSAPTTADAPFPDLGIGVAAAIADLEATTGRSLLENGLVVTPQRADGQGTDLFVATCSAAPPIRIVVAGITGDFSTRAARQAAAGTYTQVLTTISVDEPTAVRQINGLTRKASLRQASWADAQLDKLLALAPDVVLLAGGVDNGPTAPLLRLVGVISRAVDEQRRRGQQAELVGSVVAPSPLVFFAGNEAAGERVQAALGDRVPMISLPNIQPEIGEVRSAHMRDALAGLVRHKQMPRLPGLHTLTNSARREVEPTVQAVELVTRYISAEYRREVLTADVGAANTALTIAQSAAGESYRTVVRGGVGLAQGIGNLLAEAGPEAVLRWLPFESNAEEIQNWAMNRLLRPWTLAQTARDLAIEHAFAREALRLALGDLQTGRALPAATYDLLIGTGGVPANAPRVGQAAMILLDALEPTGEGVGSLEIMLDSTLMLPALGALAPVHPAAASYVFERDSLLLLGTCLVPLGPPPPGTGTAVAVHVTVEYADAGHFDIEVPYGNIEVIPLRPEQRASLKVKPGNGFRIGGGEPGKQVQTKPGEEIKGGLIGLIVDARGRPLLLPSDPAARISRLRSWNEAMRSYPAHETFDLPADRGGA